MRTMNTFDWIAWALVIVGAINWGLIGLAQFDLVAFLFGDLTVVTRTVYSIVGICAIYLLVTTLKARTSNTLIV